MTAPDSFCQIKPGGLVIAVQVSPGAKKSELKEVTPDGYLKIKLNAPAVEGKANQALLGFLSELLGVRKSAIQILSGEFARKKRVMIETTDPSKLVAKIKA